MGDDYINKGKYHKRSNLLPGDMIVNDQGEIVTEDRTEEVRKGTKITMKRPFVKFFYFNQHMDILQQDKKYIMLLMQCLLPKNIVDMDKFSRELGVTKTHFSHVLKRLKENSVLKEGNYQYYFNPAIGFYGEKADEEVVKAFEKDNREKFMIDNL